MDLAERLAGFDQVQGPGSVSYQQFWSAVEAYVQWAKAANEESDDAGRVGHGPGSTPLDAEPWRLPVAVVRAVYGQSA
jgi:hypothetical protein